MRRERVWSDGCRTVVLLCMVAATSACGIPVLAGGDSPAITLRVRVANIDTTPGPCSPDSGAGDVAVSVGRTDRGSTPAFASRQLLPCGGGTAEFPGLAPDASYELTLERTGPDANLATQRTVLGIPPHSPRLVVVDVALLPRIAVSRGAVNDSDIPESAELADR